jgi:hypothetical protein
MYWNLGSLEILYIFNDIGMLVFYAAIQLAACGFSMPSSFTFSCVATQLRKSSIKQSDMGSKWDVDVPSGNLT